MTYHDAEILAASLDALGHTTELHGDNDDWRVVLVCGCERSEGGRCHG